MRALISLPSRGRPNEFRRFVHAYAATGAIIPVRVRLDADDPTLNQYGEISLPPTWRVRTGIRKPTIELQNEFVRENQDCVVFGFMADDVVPETQNWDMELAREAGQGYLAYGDDGFEGPNIATHFFMPGGLLKANGGFAFPGLKHLYVDVVWTEIAKRLGCLKYRPDIKLRHRKWFNEGKPRTGTYIRPEGQDEADHAVYHAMDLDRIANHLRIAMPGMAA